MKRTNVYLEDNQPDELEDLSERTKQSVAQLIRRAVAHFLVLHGQSGSIHDAMQEAIKTFDDADTLERANIRQLLHWKHGREENSIRGALRRIDGKLEQLLEEKRQ